MSEKIRLTVEKVRMNEGPAFERYIGVDYFGGGNAGIKPARTEGI